MDKKTPDYRGDAQKILDVSAAETLISASFTAQESLVGRAGTGVIPAIAESPIPILAPQNRTPDPANPEPARLEMGKAAA